MTRAPFAKWCTKIRLPSSRNRRSSTFNALRLCRRLERKNSSMRIRPGRLDLTYCTNIHAGESWEEVESSITTYALPLRDHLAPGNPFGIGLRQIGRASCRERGEISVV